MHTLEPEIKALLDDGAIDAAAALRPLALERRALLSLHGELLVSLYVAVGTVIAGVGLLVKANLDHIGPVTLILAIALAAALCYGWALRTQWRGEARSLAGDYVLLLGALLLSSDVGYAEYRFHLLGEHWSLHLLLLAAVHAATAYGLKSRLVLSVALAAFAGWFGVETQFGTLSDPGHAFQGYGWRSVGCALLFVLASAVHRARRGPQGFDAVYEAFALHLAFWGALALLFAPATRLEGTLLLALATAIASAVGRRRRQESFVLAAIAYATLGACVLEGVLLHDPLFISVAVLVTLLVAVVVVLRARAVLREAA